MTVSVRPFVCLSVTPVRHSQTVQDIEICFARDVVQLIGSTARSPRAVHAPVRRSTPTGRSWTRRRTSRTTPIFILHAAPTTILTRRRASGRRAAATRGPSLRALRPIICRTQAGLRRLIPRRRPGPGLLLHGRAVGHRC